MTRVGKIGLIAAWVLALPVFAHDARADDPFSVVHTFLGLDDGEFPEAGLTTDGQNLYGTTFGTLANGTLGKKCSKSCGNVYGVDGTNLATIYSFAAGSKDGAFPAGEVLLQGTTLYGTTEYGTLTNCGGFGCGTLYEIKNSGHEKKVFKFCLLAGCADGVFPHSGLTLGPMKSLFGTTTFGGVGDGLLCGSSLGGCGVAYQLGPDGPHAIYSFCSRPKKNVCTDGAVPLGRLFYYSGDLYGTTQFGGAYAAGTIFKLSLNGSNWTEKVLYSFCKQAQDGTCADGAVPQAGLIESAGNLYGTTAYGGNACADNPAGCGTVFRIAPDGTGFATLRSFDGEATGDGAILQAPLAADDMGNLYGTTLRGGGGVCARNGVPQGCGTLFEMAANGTYRILHPFAGDTDGSHPAGALVLLGGAIYGATTDKGGVGAGGCGCGTLYSYNLQAGLPARLRQLPQKQ
jgi:uncharacterized repeat protein (TIGR03803 family)